MKNEFVSKIYLNGLERLKEELHKGNYKYCIIDGTDEYYIHFYNIDYYVSENGIHRSAFDFYNKLWFANNEYYYISAGSTYKLPNTDNKDEVFNFLVLTGLSADNINAFKELIQLHKSYE